MANEREGLSFKEIYCHSACAYRKASGCDYPNPDEEGFHCVLDKMRSDFSVGDEAERGMPGGK